MNWYLDVVTKKYAQFEGRAGRQEFWMYFAINLGIAIVLGIVDRVLAGVIGFGFLGYLYALAVLVPGLAVGARRLHDTGKSGWWQLIALTCIGVIVLIVFWAQEGEPGSNKYGPSPKGAV